MKKVFLSLGSNLGDRKNLIRQAIEFLQKNRDIKIKKCSSFYETEPWGRKNQNWFLNIAAEIETNLSPLDLLIYCNSIEKELGRIRTPENRWGERPIDIDIIFYEKEIIQNENLTIPHKHMHERKFVLEPLKEISPDFVHPILKKTIKNILDELNSEEKVCKQKKDK